MDNKSSYILLQFFWIGSIVIGKARGHFEDFTLPDDYIKFDVPSGHQGHGDPVQAFLSLEIQSINNVQEFTGEIHMEIMTTLQWKDTRVNITKDLPDKKRRYALDPVDAQKFWIPDFYVKSLKTLKTHHGSLDLRYLMLSGDKTVTLAMGVSLVMQCQFNFHHYPVDTQTCKLDFISPLQSYDEFRLLWDPEIPAAFVSRKNKLVIPEYTVGFMVCPNSFKTSYISGEVSAVRMWLILDRQLKNHLLETYLPSILLVVVSWISFFVPPDIIPGRMVLLITTLLSLVTMFEASRARTPPSIGFKCLDVWLVSCIVFVFLALMEYAGILNHIKKQSNIKMKAGKELNQLKMFTVQHRMYQDVPPSSSHGCFQRYKSVMKLQICKNIDKVSILLFPATFCTFNVLYWLSYLNIAPDEDNMNCE